MKKVNMSYILITFAALAQGVMWVNVFKMLHPDIWAYIGGIPAGLSIVGLVARSANILPRVQSKRAREAGWAILILLMLVEPIVLGFANYSAMQPKDYVVAGGASLVVSLALVLGALVDRSLVPAEKPATKRTEPATKPTEPALPAFKCAHCTFVAKSQAALNGHQSKHKPKVEAYKLNMEPVYKEKK